MGGVEVEVEGDVIVVSMPGTTYRALFFLAPDESRLIQAPQLAVDKALPISHEEFVALAWEAANEKARE
jgi:hypothetical protein